MLYDSKLHIFPGKLKSRWIGLFTIQEVYSNGVVELLNSTRSFKVNDQRLKPLLEPFSRDKEEINLLEPNKALKGKWLDGLSLLEDSKSIFLVFMLISSFIDLVYVLN